MEFITKGKTNLSYVIIFAVIATLMAIAVLSYLANTSNYNISVAEFSESKVNETQTTQKIEQTPETSKVLSYNEALITYKDKRIQFDQNCVVVPSYIVFKKGTKIMLDNRYEKVRPVYLDDAKYNLEPYGFKIITLTTAAPLPHTIRIDCGTGKNNGQILLQQ